MAKCEYCIVRYEYFDASQFAKNPERQMKNFKCPFMDKCRRADDGTA